jgi:hypothetical protein
MAVDDTLLKRLGRKIHGCFWHHDATASTEKATVAWGNNWVVVGICVKLAFLERTVCRSCSALAATEYAKADKPDRSGPQSRSWQGK